MRMLSICQSFSPYCVYVKLFEGAFNVTSISVPMNLSPMTANLAGDSSFPCKTFFRFLNVFPVIMRISIWLSIQTRQHSVSVYIQGELKYFLSDYKITGIWPEEDLAIPSSLAASIPKNEEKLPQETYRYKNAGLCSQYQEIQNRHSILCLKIKSYFELSEDFIISSEMQKEYCMHVLAVLSVRKTVKILPSIPFII